MKSPRRPSLTVARRNRVPKVGIGLRWSEAAQRQQSACGGRYPGASVGAACHPANERDRAQVGQLAAAVQEVTGDSVELAFVDQGYTGDEPTQTAKEQGMRLEVVKLPEAKPGFVLLPRSFVVARSFAWMTRFRRLARDYERLPETLAGLHLLAFIVLMLHRFAFLMAHCP